MDSLKPNPSTQPASTIAASSTRIGVYTWNTNTNSVPRKYAGCSKLLAIDEVPPEDDMLQIVEVLEALLGLRVRRRTGGQ